jgi:hypothetical protein
MSLYFFRYRRFNSRRSLDSYDQKIKSNVAISRNKKKLAKLKISKQFWIQLKKSWSQWKKLIKLILKFSKGNLQPNLWNLWVITYIAKDSGLCSSKYLLNFYQ